MDKCGNNYLIEWKTWWEKEKRAISLFHNVFKSCLVLICQNEYLWSKGITYPADKEVKFLRANKHRLVSHNCQQNYHNF